MTNISGEAFDHVVVTRFSAVFYEGQEPASDDWLFYRLGFFYDALVASMAAQKGDVDFTWLVYFDDRCSAEFRAAIDDITDGTFVPVWTHALFAGDLPGRVAAHSSGAPWLLTTRIDSDDAVATDYIAAVQAEFAPIDALTLNFQRGVQVDRSGAVYSYDQPAGPFQTFVERRTEALPRTVFGNPLHARARAFGPLREIITEPMWMQVIHGTNVANGVRGLRVRPDVVNERFAVTLPYRRDVDTRTYALERARSMAHRLQVWAREPGLAIEWANARTDRLRGTRTLDQDPSVGEARVLTMLRTLRRSARTRAAKLGLVEDLTPEQRIHRALVRRGTIAADAPSLPSDSDQAK